MSQYQNAMNLGVSHKRNLSEEGNSPALNRIVLTQQQPQIQDTAQLLSAAAALGALQPSQITGW